MSSRIDGLSHRFDGMDHRLDGMDKKFEGLGHRLDGLLGRQLLADVPLALTVAGLVLAATRLG